MGVKSRLSFSLPFPAPPKSTHSEVYHPSTEHIELSFKNLIQSALPKSRGRPRKPLEVPPTALPTGSAGLAEVVLTHSVSQELSMAKELAKSTSEIPISPISPRLSTDDIESFHQDNRLDTRDEQTPSKPFHGSPFQKIGSHNVTHENDPILQHSSRIDVQSSSQSLFSTPPKISIAVSASSSSPTTTSFISTPFATTSFSSPACQIGRTVTEQTQETEQFDQTNFINLVDREPQMHSNTIAFSKSRVEPQGNSRMNGCSFFLPNPTTDDIRSLVVDLFPIQPLLNDILRKTCHVSHNQKIQKSPKNKDISSYDFNVTIFAGKIRPPLKHDHDSQTNDNQNLFLSPDGTFSWKCPPLHVRSETPLINLILESGYFIVLRLTLMHTASGVCNI